VSGDLGRTFDPTLLANGPYAIRLTATNAGGSRSAEVGVRVNGRLKLGNMTLSATDLTIPVAGIPITVGRSYDSLDAAKVGDFGHGWKLNFGGYEVEVDDKTTDPFGNFLHDTRVTVRDAAGVGHSFKFQPVQRPDGLYNPAFVPDGDWWGNTVELVATQVLELSKLSEQRYVVFDIEGNFDINPQTSPLNFGYIVTEAVGRLETTVDGKTGDTESIKDRNGNKVTFLPDGVTSNRGRSVTFKRDELNRIAEVIDPRGNSVRYDYDPAGDLVAVTDRLGQTAAEYGYRADPAHYLETVTDADGVRQLLATYDPASKRLSKLQDAAGHPATFVHTPAAPTDPNPERATQTVTVDDGNPATKDSATVAYGKRGNPVRTSDPLLRETRAKYEDADHPDQPTRTVKVIGLPDETSGETNDLVTLTTYDKTTGRPAEVTDPAGGKTKTLYTPDGLPEYVTDPMGNGTYQRYDTRGNVEYTRSHEGVSAAFTYDANGNMETATRGGATATMKYFPTGEVKSSKTPTGVETTFAYDANGNQTGTSTVWVDPNNPANTKSVTTSTTFDAADRVNYAFDAENNKTETVYDRQNRAVKSIDPRGNVSETVYDKRGLTIESRSPDGTRTRTFYDANGRVEYATDPFVLGQADPIRGTHTVYDDLGRVKATERVTGLVIGVTTAGGHSTATLDNKGTLVSSSETYFDAAGRVDHTIQFANSPTAKANTQYEYDKAGRQTAVVTYLDATFTVANSTRTETRYDAAGRTIAQIDAAKVATTFRYDGDGRGTKTTFADGAYVETKYDGQGRKIAETVLADLTTGKTQATEFKYDALGRLTSVLQPAVVNGKTGATVRPETKYAYDDYGNQKTITDAHGRVTAFEHDWAGRQTKRTLPAVGGVKASEVKAYDKYGSLDHYTDFKGQQQDFVYDYQVAGKGALGRLVELKLIDTLGVQVEGVAYTYDAFGRTDKVTETKTGQLTRVTDTDYDTEGRTTRVTSPEGVIEYAYDPLTGRQTKVWTDKTEVQYGYDTLGRLRTVTEAKRNGSPASVVTTYAFTAVGNVGTVTVTEGASPRRTTVNDYDPTRHWLVGVTNKDGAGNVLSTFTYTRRADGQIVQAAEKVSQPGGGKFETTATFTYDALNRLTEEAVTTDDPAGGYTTGYKLDLVGNRVGKVVTPQFFGPVVETKSVFDDRDRLTAEEVWEDGLFQGTITYGYDANGSLTSRTGYQGDSATYTTDIRGRLTDATVNDGKGKVTVAEYNYTPDGIRSAVTESVNGGPAVTTQYLIDGLSPSGYAQVIEERASGLLVASYVYGAGLDPLSVTKNLDGVAGLETALYLADGHSGVRQVLDLAGAVRAAQRFDAFGNKVASAGPWAAANPVGYRGERFDATLGQYYLRARFYDPPTGRFTAMDPFAGTYSDPLQVMRYGYASGNPVWGMDPSGRMTLGGAIAVGAITGALTLGTLGAIHGWQKGGPDRLKTAIYGALVGAFIGGVIGGALSAIGVLAVRHSVGRAFNVQNLGGWRSFQATSMSRAESNLGIFTLHNHPTSYVFLGLGIATGVVVGYFFPEYGLYGAMLAVALGAAATWGFAANYAYTRAAGAMVIPGPDAPSYTRERFKGLISGRGGSYASMARATTAWTTYFLAGYLIGYVAGVAGHYLIDGGISWLERNIG
jgi:RHS repeat-associated protein